MTSVIEWIGTGSAFNPVLGHTSFWVRGKDTALLVDCGSTTPLRLLEQDQLQRVTDVLITHPHADHIGGLEALGLYHYFALAKRGTDRPRLYIPTDSMAHDIWCHALKAGMRFIEGADGAPVDAAMEDYFEVHTGLEVALPGLPKARFFPTPHVEGMENFGVRFDNGVYYSGDTTALPPSDPELIFQDCQFFVPYPGSVHLAYDTLKAETTPEQRAKMWLVHLNHLYPEADPEADGFAGMVMPGQRFEI